MADLFSKVTQARVQQTRERYAAAVQARRNRQHGQGHQTAEELSRALAAKLAAELGKPDPYGDGRRA